jgi:hypothetical protein
MSPTVCRSLILVTLVYSGTTFASDHQDSLIRGLWALTTQADPVLPKDLQHVVGIQPATTTSKSG